MKLRSDDIDPTICSTAVCKNPAAAAAAGCNGATCHADLRWQQAGAAGVTHRLLYSTSERCLQSPCAPAEKGQACGFEEHQGRIPHFAGAVIWK